MSLIYPLRIVALLTACTFASMWCSDIPQSSPLPSAGTVSGGSDGEISLEGRPIVVQDHGAAGTSDQDLIGSQAEPRWVTRRLFDQTRVGTVPDGLVDVEGWYSQDHEKHGSPGFEELTYELEMGLPYGFQVDLFQVQHKDDRQGSLHPDESGMELDKSLAKWGVIPGNPTLHAEYAVVDGGYDHLELGLLLGGGLGERIFWGSNLRMESETGGARERFWNITGAAGYSMSDRLTLGIEGLLEYSSLAETRSHYQTVAQFGPALQLRPSVRIHINAELQVGLDHSAPAAVYTVIVGCSL